MHATSSSRNMLIIICDFSNWDICLWEFGVCQTKENTVKKIRDYSKSLKSSNAVYIF